MYSIISVGNAMYSVSTYGRAHNAAMRLGFNDDIDTYLLISSKHSFAEMIYSILIKKILCRCLDKFFLPWKLYWSISGWIYSATFWICNHYKWFCSCFCFYVTR